MKKREEKRKVEVDEEEEGFGIGGVIKRDPGRHWVIHRPVE